MTFEQLIAAAKANRDGKLSELATIRDDAAAMKAAAQRARRSLSDDTGYLNLQSRSQMVGEQVNALNARIDELETEKQRDDAATGLAREVHPTGAGSPRYEQERYVGGGSTRSRDIYAAERDQRGERSYFSDLFNAQRGDVNASTRIAQFEGESRSTTTGSYGGLVVPQYLTDQAAIVARAGRPFADSCTSLQIPEQGIQLLLPRGTTGSSAAVQATENTAVSSTDEVWANVTLPVATIAGQATPSRQSLERGVPGLDALIMQDLAGAYGVALDQQCLSGSGSSGQVLGTLGTAGINQATAFVAAATATTFWTKCAGQISAVSSARGIAPDTIAMHPRRYAWLVSLVDTQGRPLVLPTTHGPANVMGQIGDGPAYGIATGQTFQGLNIVVDANIPTSVGSGPEDQVLIYRAADLLLYENGDGMPTDLRFEQTAGASLTVTLVAYGYIAFTAGRYPTAVGVVGGNSAAGFGLIAPTF